MDRGGGYGVEVSRNFVFLVHQVCIKCVKVCRNVLREYRTWNGFFSSVKDVNVFIIWGFFFFGFGAPSYRRRGNHTVTLPRGVLVDPLGFGRELSGGGKCTLL